MKGGEGGGDEGRTGRSVWSGGKSRVHGGVLMNEEQMEVSELL